MRQVVPGPKKEPKARADSSGRCVSRRVEIFHHETRLVGIAEASPRDISVAMVEPFPGVVEGLHIPILEGLRWIAGYAHVLKAAHLRLTGGSVLWFWRSGFMRWAPGEQQPPRPGLEVG